MTDVYIAYAREDRESVRRLSEMLGFEGWDVWMDPSEPSTENRAAIDLKLGSAGAILVVWSGYSRGSEYVRSEAATGLYKNKLIQVRIDAAAPPRPFDQVEVMDIARWSGERDDPNWRKIMAAVRLYAGLPGAVRPQVTRRVASAPAYLEPKRSIAWAPLIAAGVLVAAGAGVWLADPFGWRSGGSQIAGDPGAVATSGASVEGEVSLETASIVFDDTEESAANWTRVKRDDTNALRDYISDFPRTSQAETARSLLRVMDAQAWVDAVTADNEAAYQAYLNDFPVGGPTPGAMGAAARDRLVSLSAERAQAIQDIQRGLTTLQLYDGAVDGKGDDVTVRAARKFASDRKRSYPPLATAAPRDLRAFADAIQKIAGGGQAKAPIIAAATTSTNAAAEADRRRVAQAQAAALAATQPATVQQPIRTGADSLAAAELERVGDANAWVEAERAGTLAAYQSYLSAHPTGAQASAARAAIVKLNKPAPFSLDLVPSDLKAAAEAARRAQSSANARAAAAREAASAASAASGVRSIVAADGDQYEAQISGGAPNGLGVRISGGSANAGDRYRGELRNGQSSGVGVYDFASNPSNAAGALRYEGEHSADAAAGHGVTYWKNGDSFAGQETSANGQARGVMTFANGQRYEGELRDGARNGLGVVWGPDGSVLAAGRWANGELVEPAATPAGQ
ncbi:MAG: TIR domain-containing protein [Hyphomonadaceae bacterium]|nr:TIR domain-containing protein [Hyphomonadaceae bacterium]